MNLDDLDLFRRLDSQQIYEQIHAVPEQLKRGYQAGSRMALPQFPGLQQVVVCGMGAAALSAELVAVLVHGNSRLPLWIYRGHDLPAWVQGSETLVIGISLSGNTYETLTAFEQAADRGCACLAVTTGGELAELAARKNLSMWKLNSPVGEASALAVTFSHLLALVVRLGLAEDQGQELEETIGLLIKQQSAIAKEIPAANNPAKRMAGQCVGRWVTVLGSGLLAPAARSWAIQINKFAKAGAQFEQIPDVTHHLLAGVEQPENLRSQTVAIFLRGLCDSSYNRQASDLTRQFFMLQGLPTDYLDASGETPLASLWSCLHFGDYAAYYLAMAYGLDPSTSALFDAFKAEMNRNSVKR